MNSIELILYIIAFLFALTIHEFMHAWTAFKLGDPTAKLAGRVTLNPIAHLDLFGTLALIFVHFGWGKPVPINPYALRYGAKGELLVALVGPSSNFISAVIFGLLYRFAQNETVHIIVLPFVLINLVLFIFNLIPIPPLDGSKIIYALFPSKFDQLIERARFEELGTFILIGLILFDNIFGVGIFNFIFKIVNFLLKLLVGY